MCVKLVSFAHGSVSGTRVRHLQGAHVPNEALENCLVVVAKKLEHDWHLIFLTTCSDSENNQRISWS